MVIAIAVVVAVLFMVAVGAAYYYKTKKKDKGTKVVPAAKPEEAPVQPVRQPATQPATLPATQPAPASATAGAGPAAAYSQLTPETVKALRDAKKALDEGKMSEEDYRTTKAGLLGKQTPAAEATPAAKPTKGKAAKPATTPTKKAKKAKTSLVGKKVIKAFKGYKNPRDNSPYFDGVVESVEDGKCVIVWEDGDETSMTAAAARKILVEC